MKDQYKRKYFPIIEEDQMKKIVYTVLLVFVFCSAAAYAGLLDNVMKGIGSPASKGPDKVR